LNPLQHEIPTGSESPITTVFYYNDWSSWMQDTTFGQSTTVDGSSDQIVSTISDLIESGDVIVPTAMQKEILEKPKDAATVAKVEDFLEDLTGIDFTKEEVKAFMDLYAGLGVRYGIDNVINTSTFDVVRRMIEDYVLQGTPTDGGVSWVVNLGSIGGDRAAAGIYNSWTAGHAQEGSMTEAELDTGIRQLTGQTTSLPADTATKIIALGSGDGSITMNELAGLFNSGAVSFDTVAGQPGITVTVAAS
jgi:hypothetical protein